MKTFLSIFLFPLFLFSKDILPESFLKTLDGKKVKINDLNDTPMAISFWFLACEPCKKEMKYLDIYNTKYEKYGFKVVSVNTDNSRTLTRVKPFVNSQKYSFDVLSDPRSMFFRKVGGKICPYLLLVNQDGEIINRHVGYNPGDEIRLEKEIVSLLLNEINADTALVDTSIINIINDLNEDNFKDNLSD